MDSDEEEIITYPEISVPQVDEEFKKSLLDLKNQVANVTIESGEIDDNEEAQNPKLADDYQDVLTGIYLMITGINKISKHIYGLLEKYINKNESIMNTINIIKTTYNNNGKNRNIPYSDYLKNSLLIFKDRRNI